MLARDLIKYDVPPIKPYESLEKALNWMDEFRVSHLPVVDEDKRLQNKGYSRASGLEARSFEGHFLLRTYTHFSLMIVCYRNLPIFRITFAGYVLV